MLHEVKNTNVADSGCKIRNAFMWSSFLLCHGHIDEQEEMEVIIRLYQTTIVRIKAVGTCVSNAWELKLKLMPVVRPQKREQCN